jgi:hypothetical protein
MLKKGVSEDFALRLFLRLDTSSRRGDKGMRPSLSPHCEPMLRALYLPRAATGSRRTALSGGRSGAAARRCAGAALTGRARAGLTGRACAGLT